jgi:hypothetical protein
MGILGMSSTRYADLVSPDYLASVAEVYLNAARCVLKEGCLLRLLSIAGSGYFLGHTDDLESLPSWVPDWSRPPKVTSLAYLSTRLDYKAGGSKNNTEFRQIGRSLFVRGYVVDSIGRTGPFMEYPATGSAETGAEELKVLMRALEDTYSLLSHSARVSNPYTHVSPAQPLDEVFARTLIGDNSPSERPASRSFVGHVQGFERRTATHLVLPIQERFKTRWPEAPLDDGSNQMQNLASALSLRLGLTRDGMRRRFCFSEKGYVSLVPPLAQTGDLICVMLGEQTPLAIRRAESMAKEREGTRYHLVGEAYFHGLMDGEALAHKGETELLELI